MKTLFLLPGWKSNGDGVRRLRNELRDRGHNVEFIRYGFVLTPWKTVTTSKAVAIMLAGLVANDDPAETRLIGHSNGCNIISRAAEIALDLAQPFPEHAIYISPALDRKTCRHALERVDVLHTKKDQAVRWARYVPFSRWGDMGRGGYKGDDPAYTNHDGTERIGGHSEWFEPQAIKYTADKIEELL